MQRILLVLLTLSSLILGMVQAGANTLYVAPTDNDAGAGTETDPYATIQHALDVAAEGDTIDVAPGTYRENLVWQTKSLILRGAGAGISIVDGDVDDDGAGDGSCLRVHNVPDTARVSGFTFQHGSGYFTNEPNPEEDPLDLGGGLYLFTPR